MAFAHPFVYGSVPEHSNIIDTRQAVFFESPGTKAATLGPSIKDSGVMSSDQEAQYRRDSCTNSAGVLSPPSEHKWESKYEPSGLGIDSGAHVHSTNPFHVHDHPRMAQLSSNGTSSAMSHASSTIWTPDHDFDAHQYPPTTLEHPSSQSIYASYAPIQHETSYLSNNQSQMPMSPQSGTEWMNLAAQESHGRSLPRRMRPSISSRASIDHSRPDGIRKKNTRIEIPHEHNLGHIEHLIEIAQDEDDIKELKSQRRLLRNREAALASRQRKKKHTEELEIKEKGYQSDINTLKAELSELQRQLSASDSEKQFIAQHNQTLREAVQNLRLEQQELVIRYTDESGQLRRKVQYLTEQLDNGPPAMSAVPSSSGFTDVTSDMDSLTVAGAHDWESLIFANDTQDLALYSYFDNSPVKSEQPILASTKIEKATQAPVAIADQPVASGILFMLLLCGAFVASKPTSSPLIPRMPEEVRAASTTILDSLLHDTRSDMLVNDNSKASLQMQSNGIYTPHPSSSDGRLSTMHHHLTAPSMAQETDQIFAMTPAQYNSIANPSYPSSQLDQNNAGLQRRNLAQTLANLREGSIAKGGAAEVYTRSLLWDQIPADVVKQFQDLVQDSKKNEALPRNSDGSNYGYKIES